MTTKRPPKRDMRGPFVLADDDLAMNVEGLHRLCKQVGIDTHGTPTEVARRYLQWSKRNPQPRVDRR